MIITASGDKTVGILSGDDLKVEHYLKGHTRAVICCSYGQSLCISGGSDKTVRLWDVRTAKEISAFNEEDVVAGCDIFADDRFLCTNVRESCWSVWDCRTSKRVRQVQWTGEDTCWISPCGQFVSVCGGSKWGVFSVSDGKPILIKDGRTWDTQWISPTTVLSCRKDNSRRRGILHVHSLQSSHTHTVGRAMRCSVGGGYTMGVDRFKRVRVWKAVGM